LHPIAKQLNACRCKSSLGGALGGQLITLLAGSAANRLALPLGLALAYGGSQLMNEEGSATLWLTTGLYAVPTSLRIAEKVAEKVIIEPYSVLAHWFLLRPAIRYQSLFAQWLGRFQDA